jgi:formyl-CoA transferase/CoA:oxalate CoA-transferase
MDLIVQAAAGLISFTGTPEGSLVRSGHSVADITAGMFALIGILLALRGRDQTGRGSYVDVSMLDGMISAMASSFATFFGTGVPPIPRGTAFATLVPYACFPTGDRDVAIAVSSDKLWKGFCLALERPEWITDPRFAGNGARVENRSVLEPAIAEVLRTRPAAEWLDRFRLHGVPATLVNDLADVAADPQALAREMFPQVSHAVAGSHRVTGAPVKLSDAPAGAGSAAPRLGQDTRSVLRELLGRSDAEVDLLVAEGVVVAPVAVPEARPR